MRRGGYMACGDATGIWAIAGGEAWFWKGILWLAWAVVMDLAAWICGDCMALALELEPWLAVVVATLAGEAAAVEGGVFWLVLMTWAKIVEAKVARLPCETLDLACFLLLFTAGIIFYFFNSCRLLNYTVIGLSNEWWIIKQYKKHVENNVENTIAMQGSGRQRSWETIISYSNSNKVTAHIWISNTQEACQSINLWMGSKGDHKRQRHKHAQPKRLYSVCSQQWAT